MIALLDNIYLLSSFLIGIVLLCLGSLRDERLYLFVLAYFSYFTFVCIGWFHLFKFGGSYDYLFPDERLYHDINSSGGVYGWIVSLLARIFTVSFNRAINIILFCIIVRVYVVNNFMLLSPKMYLLALLSFVFASYWSFFVLKEMFTLLGMALFFAGRKVGHRRSGGFLLLIFRPEFFLICIGAFILERVNSISRFLSVGLALSSLGFVVANFNSPVAIGIKLFALSRRFGESFKEYDDAALEASRMDFFEFLSSKEFGEILSHNLSECFAFWDVPLLELPLVLINVFGLVSLLSLLFRRYELFRSVSFLSLFLITLALMVTHNTVRYQNVVFLAYLITIISRFKNEKNSGFTRIQV